MGISSQEGLSLTSRANSFLKSETRDEIVASISGAEIPDASPIVRPVPVYSFVPFYLE